MSCNCSCRCEGAWETPAISLPIHSINFEGDMMHCAQVAYPQHQLRCNVPELLRRKRSKEAWTNEEDRTIHIVFMITTLFLLCVCALLAYSNYKLQRSLNNYAKMVSSSNKPSEVTQTIEDP